LSNLFLINGAIVFIYIITIVVICTHVQAFIFALSFCVDDLIKGGEVR